MAASAPERERVLGGEKQGEECGPQWGGPRVCRLTEAPARARNSLLGVPDRWSSGTVVPIRSHIMAHRENSVRVTWG